MFTCDLVHLAKMAQTCLSITLCANVLDTGNYFLNYLSFVCYICFISMFSKLKESENGGSDQPSRHQDQAAFKPLTVA